MNYARKGRGWKVRPGLVPALLLVALGAAPVRPDSLAELATPLPETGEPLLFALRLDQQNLRDDLPVLQRGRAYFVPLGELLPAARPGGHGRCRARPRRRLPDRRKKRFELDAKFRTVTLTGERRPFDGAAVLQEHDDLYVDAAKVGDWLPLSLEVRPNDLLIRVLPREPLPLQLRLAREKKLAAARRREAAADLPRLALPYRLFDGPFADAVAARLAPPQRGRRPRQPARIFADRHRRAALPRVVPLPGGQPGRASAMRASASAARIPKAGCWAGCTPASLPSARSSIRGSTWWPCPARVPDFS